MVIEKRSEMRQNNIEFIGQPEPGSSRPFSRMSKAGGMVYVSGHSAPHDPATGVFRGDTPHEEVRNALTLIKALLEQAGSSIDLVVQVTMLITDPADYYALNEEYVKHFPNAAVILPKRQKDYRGFLRSGQVRRFGDGLAFCVARHRLFLVQPGAQNRNGFLRMGLHDFSDLANRRSAHLPGDLSHIDAVVARGRQGGACAAAAAN